jgi:hypothetical protein
MTIKININRRLPIDYKKFIHHILEVDSHFNNLDHINHIINPVLQFTTANQLKKRELIFNYPIPSFLLLVIGDLFKIKVVETSVINKNRCSVNCIIKINTLLGEIKFLETAIYTRYDNYTSLKIELSSITNNLRVILQKIANIWKIDREKYIEKILNCK